MQQGASPPKTQRGLQLVSSRPLETAPQCLDLIRTRRLKIPLHLFFFKTPFKFAATKYLNQMIIKRKNVYIITCEVPTGEEGPEGILNTFLKEKPLEL